MFFGADNVDEALKIYPEPSNGEDIRPQISVSDIECNKSLYLGGCESSQCSLFKCELYFFFFALGNRY